MTKKGIITTMILTGSKPHIDAQTSTFGLKNEYKSVQLVESGGNG
jgi:hypothetical protein